MPKSALPRKFSFSTVLLTLALSSVASTAHAVSSAELYTTAAYQYGRFEARVRFGFGDGIVSSFFLWKVGSEMEGTFWNELDFEKLWADCVLETNALYGDPEASHSATFESDADLCGQYHTYGYEWTPDYIVWTVDGVEIRRETGETAQVFRDNATQGMRIHFNIWPGDASFGGNFDPAVLPVRQYVNWVQYSSYSNGAFELEWREDFEGGSVPAGWETGNWLSPKNLSTHVPANVQFIDGYAVISLTADDQTGTATDVPADDGQVTPPVGTGGAAGEGGVGNPGAAGAAAGGAPGQGGADGFGGGGGAGAVPSEPPMAGGQAGTSNPEPQPGAGGGAPNPNPSGQPSGGNPTQEPPIDPVPSVPSTSPAPTLTPTAPAQTTPPTATPQPAPTVSAAPSPSQPAVNDATSDEGEEGCACHLPHPRQDKGWQWLALMGALIGLRRLRRSRSAH
jgi:hypothetical protein